jgi:hypothetical protein
VGGGGGDAVTCDIVNAVVWDDGDSTNYNFGTLGHFL